jgi:trans-aconitate methyltransferase
MPHEFDGKKYKKASSHQKGWGNKVIAELKLRGATKVSWTSAAATGADRAVWRRWCRKVPVIGIDASRNMIETAGSLAGGNLSFRVLDINLLDYDNQFDLVFSNAALHWVKDHRRLLENVWRSLRDGGRLRANFAAEGNCPSLMRITKEALALPEYRGLFSGFEWPWYTPEPPAYEALVRQLRFTEVRVWGEDVDHYFPDSDAMIQWVDQPSLVPFLKYIPEAEGKSFRQARNRPKCRGDYAKETEGRCLREAFRRINVAARK